MTSATVGGASAFALQYDGKGRLQRTSGAGSTTTYYLYDGDQLVGEYNSSGTVLRRFVHGAGVDDPLVWFEGPSIAASNRQYLMADERGSIVGVTNNSGTVTNINLYDDWGIPGPGNVGQFGYTGQLWLSALGMNYYKARMYSPTLGRFMQTDPIGYEDGMNMYAYVGNDPMNAADPSGLIDVSDQCRDRSACNVIVQQRVNIAHQEGRMRVVDARISYSAASSGLRVAE